MLLLHLSEILFSEVLLLSVSAVSPLPFLSLFFIELSITSLSQYVHVKMTVKLFCSPQNVVPDNYN